MLTEHSLENIRATSSSLLLLVVALVVVVVVVVVAVVLLLSSSLHRQILVKAETSADSVASFKYFWLLDVVGVADRTIGTTVKSIIYLFSSTR
jgi:flagellar basal body-associated protein FliL